MDMDNICFDESQGVEHGGSDNFGDTALCLNCFSYETHGGGGISRKDRKIDLVNVPDDGCKLVLGLGPTPSAYCDDHSSGIEYSLSVANTSSTSVTPFPELEARCMIPVVDEGSTSARKSGGYMPSLLLAPRSQNSYSHPQVMAEPSSSESRGSSVKRCSIIGCSKGARGASSLCICHGGGQRCQKVGCNKGAESRTAFCKSHGGGRRCQNLGCTKSAEGKTEYCIAHGGGRRCTHEGGCSKAARGKSGLCIRHGGGKRCKIEVCTRSAEGQSGLCISHGGGRRCQHEGCQKGAQGSTKFCKAHGGGKRCMFAGCTKGAEGSTPLCKRHGGGKRCLFNGGGICPKSVHGGTNFCVAHGGGKRCVVEGCTKSARGRTECCVRHGGGKRCKHENCGKSAQGSTDFCKAHGGGKRCSWGGGKCEKFARGKSGLCAAHRSMVEGNGGSKGGSMLGPGLFHGVVSSASSAGISTVHDSVDSPDHHLIPPQVLLPEFMKSSSSYTNSEKAKQHYIAPEGRVHGGGLMSFLKGNWHSSLADEL